MTLSLLNHQSGSSQGAASLVVHRGRTGAAAIHPHLFAKFCEHLGQNIANGMDAQILRNPTFGRWQFHGGECPANGGERGQSDHDKVLDQIRERSRAHAVPDPELAVQSYGDGLAFHWLRLGPREQVRVSPDTAPAGGRAQRVEILAPGTVGGIHQGVWLPLHRTSNYIFEIQARGVGATVLALELADSAGAILASSLIRLDDAWSTRQGTMSLPVGLDPLTRVEVRLTASQPCAFVVARLMLLPDDHVGGADRDVIAALREQRLPLLRWPGGNFVSGYRWRDGIGPSDQRPTRPNPAWEGLETNRFGTAEFVAFCQAVGCEPMICVNAGDGTPEEAADWVLYCNGGPDTAMGRLRAAHGHPEPFQVQIWEIGNELWGRWQVGWTTPTGNADRYQRFVAAMTAADPGIECIATGAQCTQDQEWTHRLLEPDGPRPRCLTDHLLSGSDIGPAHDPWEIFQAYLGHATDAARQYRWLREQMLGAGIVQPQIALTEMQIFCHWNPRPEATGTMSRDQLIHPGSQAEAAFFISFLCESVRLDGFIRMITHSATVNHGGGLRKTRERVWANPVHHAHVLARALSGGEPLAIDLTCATYDTVGRYGFIPPLKSVPVLDAVAAELSDGSLALIVVSRARQTIALEIRVDDWIRGEAEVVMIAGEAPWDQNTSSQTGRIAPRSSRQALNRGVLAIPVPPAAVLRVLLPAS